MIFRENRFKTTYDLFSSLRFIVLKLSEFNDTKSPLLNPLSLETQKKPRKVRPHSAPWKRVATFDNIHVSDMM
jgi:hypothetical protein